METWTNIPWRDHRLCKELKERGIRVTEQENTFRFCNDDIVKVAIETKDTITFKNLFTTSNGTSTIPRQAITAISFSNKCRSLPASSIFKLMEYYRTNIPAETRQPFIT